MRCAFAAVLAALIWTGSAGPVHAQAIRGTLLGTVTDQTGGALPGVTVIATEQGTKVTRETVTNETGNYTFPNLVDGVYSVKAELTGFKTVVRENVRVAVNTSVRIDVGLEVGAMEETVTVVSETPLLQTDRTDTGRLIESIQVQAIPLSFNRNFQGLLATVPGATRPFRPHSEFFNPQDSLSTQVNGQSRLANNVQIEGIDNNHRTGLLTVLIPPAEAIDQVSVSTSNYDAEFGRAAGAVTSVTLRSGTNNLRGSAVWFGNTEATNATPASTYFSTNKTKPETSYNQVGFTLGGPIKQNNLFYFGDYQYTRDILGGVARMVVPTEAFRRGDFSGAPTLVYDPATGDAAGNGRTAFPGNQIPASRFSPIALNLLSKIPLPNLPGVALGQPNYQVNGTRDKITHSFDTKVNWAVGQNDQLSWRLSYQKPEVVQLTADGYGDWGGPAWSAFAATGTNMTYSTAVNWTRTFSNTLIMESRGGVSYYHNEALQQGYGQKLAEEVGIAGINIDDWTSGPPRINLANGFPDYTLGYVGSLPWDRYERTWEFASTLTKLWGNHTVKFGGNWRHNTDMLLQTQDNNGPRGGYAFAGAMTGSPADTAANAGLANSFAAFLLDRPSGIARDLKVIDEPGTKHWTVAGFVHDKWQVSQKLTLDLGVRWEYYDPFVGIEGQGSLSNYDPTINALRVSGYGGNPDNLGVKKDWDNWGPRLGASYRLDDRTVMRAGYGASTTPFPDNRYAFNFPVKQNNAFSGPNSFSPAGSMAAGFPAPIVAQIPSDGIIPANTSLLLSQSFWHVPEDIEQGTIHTYNVAFQRELFWGLTGEIAYVGNRSDDVLTRFPMNAGMTPGLDRAGQPLFVLYGKTAGVENLGWKAKTRYNALQAKVDRKFRGGWMVTNSYTYGKAKDYHSENGNPSTPADIEKSWGYSDFDRTHTFVNTFVWALPWFKEDAGAMKWILGNWQVSGLFTAMSGTPVNITANAATLRAPGNTQFPDQLGEVEVYKEYGPGIKYFDVTKFAAPAANTFGNRSRNIGDIRGPAFINLDFSVTKQFPFGGSRLGEFRVDVWNLTNSPHFGNPNGSFGSTNFGEVNSASGERQMRFAVRFLF
jgi:outer membrane receptor protein involved in Fe transport